MPNARRNFSLGLLQHGSCFSRRYGSLPPPLSARVYVPQEQPTVIDEASRVLYRVRSHGNRQLPMPPFMDARVIEAKTKHQQTKLDPTKAGQTKLQQDLAANVYAQAFATPIRCCGLTKARLPAHFLQAFTAEFVKIEGSDSKTRVKSQIIPASVRYRAPTSQKNKFAHSTTYVLNSSTMLGHLDSNNGNWMSVPNQRMYEQAMLKAGSKNTKRKDLWLVDPDMKGKTRNALVRMVEVEISRLMLRGSRGAVARGWELRILGRSDCDVSSSSQSPDEEKHVLVSKAKESFQLMSAIKEPPDGESLPACASFVALSAALGTADDGAQPRPIPGNSPLYGLAALYGIDEHRQANDSNADPPLSKWVAIATLLESELNKDLKARGQVARTERYILGIRKDQSTVNLRIALERLRTFVEAA